MRLLLVAAAIAALSSPALAQTAWTATPVQPLVKKDFVASSVVWDCDMTHCVATSDTSGATEMVECRKLVGEVGALSQFVGASGPFKPERLGHCNEGAAKPKS